MILEAPTKHKNDFSRRSQTEKEWILFEEVEDKASLHDQLLVGCFSSLLVQLALGDYLK